MQRRLRPKQGGRFMRPVGPAPEVVAQIRGQDPRLPAAVRAFAGITNDCRNIKVGGYVKDVTTGAGPWHVVGINEAMAEVHIWVNGGTLIVPLLSLRAAYEPSPGPIGFPVSAPEPKPVETTFGELAVGEGFVWANAEPSDRNKDVPRTKTKAGWRLFDTDVTDGGFETYRVRRVS